MKAPEGMSMSRARATMLLVCVASVLLTPSLAYSQSTPPMYNDRSGYPPYCEYAAQGSVCGSDCLCDPTIESTGWPGDGCSVPTGWWPGFATLFYTHRGACSSAAEFHEFPLLDLPGGVLEGGDWGLIPNYNISISPISKLGRIREIPLECSPERSPVDAAARYQINLGGYSNIQCNGAIFYVTAEFNPTLFDVVVCGRIRSGAYYDCGSTALEPELH